MTGGIIIIDDNKAIGAIVEIIVTAGDVLDNQSSTSVRVTDTSDSSYFYVLSGDKSTFTEAGKFEYERMP